MLLKLLKTRLVLRKNQLHKLNRSLNPSQKKRIRKKKTVANICCLTDYSDLSDQRTPL